MEAHGSVNVSSRGPDTRPARTGNMRKAAFRALEDPATLNKAARIVRAALLRQKLTLDDLQGDVVQPVDLGEVA